MAAGICLKNKETTPSGTMHPDGVRSSKNSGDFLTTHAPFAYEPAAHRAANGDRNPLLRKGSETTVYAAGFGLIIRGLRPSDTSKASV